IPRVVAETLEKTPAGGIGSVDDVLSVDAVARKYADEIMSDTRLRV
ncbi:unnamed protein product, partial [Laminaria digitata]